MTTNLEEVRFAHEVFSRDVAREILLNMEEKMPIEGFPSPFHVEDVQILAAPDTELKSIYYHIEKLEQARFITVLDARTSDTPYVLIPVSMTYAGHQFLDDIRDPSRWKKIKSVAGPVSFETLKAMLPEILKQIAGGA